MMMMMIMMNEVVDDKLENVAFANARPPEPRQSSPTLITTPCQVWSHWTYLLPYCSFFAADALLYVLTVELEHLQCIACDVMKLCAKFEPNWAIPRPSYCDLNIWPNDLGFVGKTQDFPIPQLTSGSLTIRERGVGNDECGRGHLGRHIPLLCHWHIMWC